MTATCEQDQIMGEIPDGTDDALGSVRLVTDSTGGVVARFDYSAWGELLGSSFDNVPNGGTPYRFVGTKGIRWDADLDICYIRDRWYDSALRTFISRDFLHTLNRYSYANHNPSSYVDVNGLRAILSDSMATICNDPDYRIKFDAAIEQALIYLDEWEKDCGCLPRNIDYRRFLTGNWDVTFTAASPDLNDKMGPDALAWYTMEPWKTGGKRFIYGSDMGCPGARQIDIRTLAYQILHELTHAGLQALYKKGWADPKSVGPVDERSHPIRYFRDGIDKCKR